MTGLRGPHGFSELYRRGLTSCGGTAPSSGQEKRKTPGVARRGETSGMTEGAVSLGSRK